MDDEKSLRMLFSMALTATGRTVETSCDGLEALHAARRHPFDLVLLDLRMPRLNGLEFLKQLRTEGNTSRVIVCSAELDASTIAKLIPLGVVTFLSKPLSLTSFRKEVSLHLAPAGSGALEKALRLAERQRFREAAEIASKSADGLASELWQEIFKCVAGGQSERSLLPYIERFISVGNLIR